MPRQRHVRTSSGTRVQAYVDAHADAPACVCVCVRSAVYVSAAYVAAGTGTEVWGVDWASLAMSSGVRRTLGHTCVRRALMHISIAVWDLQSSESSAEPYDAHLGVGACRQNPNIA